MFGLCWKPTAARSSQLQPSTHSPGVTTPAPAPARQHRLLRAANTPCNTQKRKTASSQVESWNNQLWVCPGRRGGPTLTPQGAGAPAPAAAAGVATPSTAPEPAEHS